MAAVNELKKQARKVNPPESYFKGRLLSDHHPVDNLVIFVRRSRKELQQRTMESRPHHRFVLVLVLETSGTVILNRKQFSLSENCGLLIFPYQFHQFLDLAEDDLLWVIITFEIDDPDSLSLCRDRIFKIDRSLQEQVLHIIQSYNQKRTSLRDLEILLSATMFLRRIKQQLKDEFRQHPHHNPHSQGGPGQDLLSRIDKELIDYKWNAFPRIAQLANKLGYSESRLRSLFKEHFELSLGSYLRNFQIHTAISLMKNSGLSLTDIAYESGFSSTAVFSRSFKKHTHSTPKDYRKNMLRIP